MVQRNITVDEQKSEAIQPLEILFNYPRRARSALGVDIVLTLDVCLYVCMYVSALERKRLIGMT